MWVWTHSNIDMSKQQVALASRSFLVAVVVVVVVVAVVVVVDGYLFFLFPPAFNFDFDLISINYTRYELAHPALFIVPSYHQSGTSQEKEKKPLYAQTAIRIYTTCSFVSTHSHVHLRCSVVINAVFFFGASGIPNRRCIVYNRNHWELYLDLREEQKNRRNTYWVSSAVSARSISPSITRPSVCCSSYPLNRVQQPLDFT